MGAISSLLVPAGLDPSEVLDEKRSSYDWCEIGIQLKEVPEESLRI